MYTADGSGNPISFKCNFRSSGGTANRNVYFKMRYDPGNPDYFSGTGLAASDSILQSLGGLLKSGYTSNNVRYYQPVFRAGTGFITTYTFAIGQNEDVSALYDNVVLYGGTNSSNVTTEVV